LELPFLPGERWALTGGPHITWNTGTPRGAIDFAPVTGEPRCAVSRAWVTASASGVVTRSERSVVVIDLDGDGLEQTGWALVYLHMAESERVPAGVWVDLDDPIGHPSCEGGTSTGTHVHLARKFNGEWLPASGMVPFILSGWEVQAGERAYEGYLVKGDQVVSARPEGSSSSSIYR
jgi:LasA protease